MLAAKPRNDISYLASGLNVTSDVDVNFDRSVTLNSLQLKTDNGTTIEGNASYKFDDKTFYFDGPVEIAPESVAGFTTAFTPAGPITGAINIDGAADLFTFKGELETPKLSIGEQTTPALEITAALSGLPHRPTGDISAAPWQGAGGFNATLRSSTNGRVSLTKLDYKGADFSLTGDGGYDPNTGQLELNLDYQGGEEAAPWPGLILTGDFTAKGVLGLAPSNTNFVLNAESLKINENAVEQLAVTAAGPADRIQIDVTANKLLTAQTDVIESVMAKATINSQDGMLVRLSDFGAIVADTAVSLTSPADFVFENGAVVDGLRLRWGEEARRPLTAGSIKIAGR